MCSLDPTLQKQIKKLLQVLQVISLQHLDPISREGRALHSVCVETANAYYQLPNTLLLLVVIHVQQPDALVSVKQMSCLMCIAEKPIKKRG